MLMTQCALFTLRTWASDCWRCGSVCSDWLITRYTGCRDRQLSVHTTLYYMCSCRRVPPDDCGFLRSGDGRNSANWYPVVCLFLPGSWLMMCYWSSTIRIIILICVCLCVQFGLIRYVGVLVLIVAIIAEMKGFCYLLTRLILIGLGIVIRHCV